VSTGELAADELGEIGRGLILESNYRTRCNNACVLFTRGFSPVTECAYKIVSTVFTLPPQLLSKPLKRLSTIEVLDTGLKPGVNETT
jgi:hypothetical protein